MYLFMNDYTPKYKCEVRIVDNVCFYNIFNEDPLPLEGFASRVVPPELRIAQTKSVFYIDYTCFLFDSYKFLVMCRRSM